MSNVSKQCCQVHLEDQYQIFSKIVPNSKKQYQFFLTLEIVAGVQVYYCAEQQNYCLTKIVLIGVDQNLFQLTKIVFTACETEIIYKCTVPVSTAYKKLTYTVKLNAYWYCYHTCIKVYKKKFSKQ